MDNEGAKAEGGTPAPRGVVNRLNSRTIMVSSAVRVGRRFFTADSRVGLITYGIPCEVNSPKQCRLSKWCYYAET